MKMAIPKKEYETQQKLKTLWAWAVPIAITLLVISAIILVIQNLIGVLE